MAVKKRTRAEQQRDRRARDPERFNAAARARYRRTRDHSLARAKQWRLDNPEKAKACSRAWRKNNWHKHALLCARNTARKTGKAFDLTLADIHAPSRCPVLGIVLRYEGGRRCEVSATLDRIDNSKGYVRGNVITVSWRANRLKNDATVEELVLLARYYDFWS